MHIPDKRPRIALVDDNPDDRRLAIRELAQEFKDVEFIEIAAADEFGDLLAKGDFDLLITDYQIQWTDGLAILKKVKDKYPACPVIMFTGSGSQEVAVDGMKLGLDDYVIKSPRHFVRLRIAARACLERVGVQREAQKLAASLQTQEERFRLLVETIPDYAIILLAPDNHITSWNLGAQSIFGYAPEEVMGREGDLIFTPEDRAAHKPQEEIETARRDGSASDKRWHIRKNGERFFARGVMTALYSPDRRLLGFTKLLHDESSTLATQHRLEQYGRQQTALAELGQLALSGLNLEELQKEAVAQVAEILRVDYAKILEVQPDRQSFRFVAGAGWPREVLNQTTLTTAPVHQAGFTLAATGPIVVRDAKEETRFTLSKFLRDSGVVSGVTTKIFGPGTPYGVLGVHAKTPRDFNTDEVNFIRAMANVIGTAIQRTQWEHDLVKERNAFQALTDSQPGIVYLFDAQGHFLRWNQQFERVTGYSAAQIEKMRPREFIVEAHRAAVEQSIRTAFENGFASLDADLLTCDGRAIPYSFTGRRMLLGERDCIVGVGIDNSERKKVQDELRQSTEALREVDQHKNEFLAMLAHELRNPLGPIRNSVQILRRRMPSDPEAERLRTIVDRQVTHMARLIDDLLDVSRISRGKILLRKERIDLAPVVRSTVEDNRALFEAAELKLETEICSDPVWVTGDATRLAQCVGNLLNNALKFTDAGGAVTVGLHKDPASAWIDVSDTGIGIPAEMIKNVFEPFVQADRSIDRSRGGLGLGLALVKGLIELHEGEVRVSSAGPNQGTRFSIRLPLQDRPDVAGAPPAKPEPTQSSCRILLVEDNADAAETTRILLQLAGHDVEAVSSGLLAIQAALRFKPDVVICDIGLPGGMDGYAVARTLRADASLASCYIIALTGYGQEEDQKRARHAGFDIHLTKPLDPDVLEGILRNLCLENP